METTQIIRRSLLTILVVVASAGIASVGWAQDPIAQLAESDRGPRFLMATAREMVALDVSRTPVLRRRVSIDMRQAPLRTALDAIARQAGLNLSFSPDIVNLESLVTLEARNLTVAAALTEVLIDMRLDVVLSPSGQLSLVRQPKLSAVGVVTGRVIDASSQQGVPGVRVSLEGTRWSTTTGNTGSYRLTGVAAGSYTLVTRRLGYRASERPVVVEDDREVALEVALEPVPSALNEVVVTATGEQRRVELGHVVGRINADSLVREAPVSTVSELLTARVPGLQVFQSDGSVGGRVKIQSRGPNSFTLKNEPIVVIDGVRYTTAERPALFCCISSGSVEPSSPLNDLNPNDIASVEIVKGPSAATLYGTDAANGVIVITTKRGGSGPARWNAYAKMSTTDVETEKMPDIYWGWGTVSGIPNNPNLSCNLARLVSLQCTGQDSVTVIRNPLKNPDYTIFAEKPTWEYGLNASGGRSDIQYYAAASFTDAIGPIRMPSAFARELKAIHGRELPREWREPNVATDLNLRSNVSMVLSPKVQLRLNTGYVRSRDNALSLDGAYLSAMAGATPANSTRPYGQAFNNPIQAFARQSTDKVGRFLGSANLQWQPASQVTIRANAGTDVLSSERHGLVRPGDQAALLPTGEVEDTRTRQTTTTADIAASVVNKWNSIGMRTTIGAQYVRSLYDSFGGSGTGLTPGASTVPAALSVVTRVSYLESALLGGYLEETLSWRDRLFLTAAVRMDGAASFGRNFDAAWYPKMGLSWLISQESFFPRIRGLDELRLRYGHGVSGRQPDPSWSRPSFSVTQMDLNGQRSNAFSIGALGNPDIRPERVSEYEFGLDGSAWQTAMSWEVTRFSRRTTDQIVAVPQPSGLPSVFTNLGLTTQKGIEARADGRVIDTRVLSLNLGMSHSSFSTKLVDIGTASMVRSASGGYVQGYPLGARFGRVATGFNDANNDGIVGLNELVLSDTAIYLGLSRPSRVQTFSVALGAIQQRLRLSALIDRQAGFTQIDPFACFSAVCQGLVDKTVSPEGQFRMLLYRTRVPQKADFTRFREASLALSLPDRYLRPLRMSRAMLTISGRNLGLWTKFSGPDPEVSDPNPAFEFSSVANASAIGIPLGRVLSFRFDITR